MAGGATHRATTVADDAVDIVAGSGDHEVLPDGHFDLIALAVRVDVDDAGHGFNVLAGCGGVSPLHGDVPLVQRRGTPSSRPAPSGRTVRGVRPHSGCCRSQYRDVLEHSAQPVLPEHRTRASLRKASRSTTNCPSTHRAA